MILKLYETEMTQLYILQVTNLMCRSTNVLLQLVTNVFYLFILILNEQGMPTVLLVLFFVPTTMVIHV